MQVTGGREGLKAVEREVLMKVGDSTNAERTSILAVADTLYSDAAYLLATRIYSLNPIGSFMIPSLTAISGKRVTLSAH